MPRSSKTFTGLSLGNGLYIISDDPPYVGIKNISSEVPKDFSLSQNFPNPFNPTTNIRFALPKAGFVKLAVFDILGREVETLVNEDLIAGSYNADWNASKYSSGVYFYKLETEGFAETKKMVLTK